MVWSWNGCDFSDAIFYHSKNGHIRLVFEYFGIQMVGLVHRLIDDVHADQPFKNQPPKCPVFKCFHFFKGSDFGSILFNFCSAVVTKIVDPQLLKTSGYQTIISIFQVMI